jgi:hypothetical protein
MVDGHQDSFVICTFCPFPLNPAHEITNAVGGRFLFRGSFVLGLQHGAIAWDRREF